jgi:hypothetical protein
MHGVRPRLAWLLLAAASACGIAGTALAARTSGQAATVESSESRAIGYLAREVPAWRRDHPCYSCHNNGDAARALMAALRRNHPVRPALDDTLAWLGQPSRWRTNGGGEGGGDDKRLARIQFANATAVAADASLVPAAALAAAAEIVAADQQPDGSWRLDSSDSIGSPATYGTALATFYARRALAVSGLPAMTARVARADRWLAALAPVNVPDAAAVLFAFAGTTSARPAGWHASLTLLANGQGRSGGWGPYATSPAEPFDTALAVLAIIETAPRR